MEQESILTGYCRQIDGSRMVTLVTEAGRLTEVDCCFGACPHEPACLIAQSIRDHLRDQQP